MSDDIAIKVENLTKLYKLYNSPTDRLKEALSPIRQKYHHDFHALHNVSFEVKRGESVGIIGKNGSGKSTLLKLITGILSPSSGSVQVNGRISALLELGAGFNPELTGIENIYFNGTLMGYSKEEMDARLDSILGFADIGEFVKQPIKTYSSGMFVRLAFAVAVNVAPDILVVDEALSVGDLRFQKKCKERMNDFKDSGITILLVSHAMSDIRAMCNTGLFLQQGSLLHWGDASEAINKYFEVESKDDSKEILHNNIAHNYGGDIAGTGDVILKNIKCYQRGNDLDINTIEFGKEIVVELDYESMTRINKPILTINVGSAYYRIISNISSLNHGYKFDELTGSGKVRIEITNPQFTPGAYVLHVALSSENINVHYFMHNSAASFVITAPQNRPYFYPATIVQPDATFTIEANNV